MLDVNYLLLKFLMVKIVKLNVGSYNSRFPITQ
jgi:hypothetical protein